MRSFVVSPRHISDGVDWDKETLLDKYWLDWAGTDDPEEAAQVMEEDMGWTVANSLGEACEILYNESRNYKDALNTIDVIFGTGAGFYPLSEYSMKEQQKIYTKWMKEFHPDELN